MPKFSKTTVKLTNTEWETIVAAVAEYTVTTPNDDAEYVEEILKKIAEDVSFNATVEITGLAMWRECDSVSPLRCELCTKFVRKAWLFWKNETTHTHCVCIECAEKV
jgi:hypothetical protein